MHFEHGRYSLEGGGHHSAELNFDLEEHLSFEQASDVNWPEWREYTSQAGLS